MARIASIGLQAYKELVQPILVNKLSTGLKLNPSKTDILFPHVIALANSICVEGLPSELTPTKFVLPPKETERVIMPRFDQLKCIDKGVQTNYERNLNASTIRTHLDFANQIVKERNKLGVLSDSPLLTQFESLPLAALVHQKHWLYISGEVDHVWNGFVPLPAIPSIPHGIFDEESYREFESACDTSVSKIKPIFPVVLNTHVEIKSGFAIQRGMLQYPCVQVHVKWKKDAKDSRTTDTFLGQCALYLLSSSIATSFIRSRDEPSLMIGLVSDGYRYYILAFQLNTLDFDVSSKVKNIFWMKEVDMVKRGKFNIEAMEHLVQLFSFIYGAQQKGIKKSRQR